MGHHGEEVDAGAKVVHVVVEMVVTKVDLTSRKKEFTMKTTTKTKVKYSATTINSLGFMQLNARIPGRKEIKKVI